jgi:DNA-binding beta-propeller fold protein YncE
MLRRPHRRLGAAIAAVLVPAAIAAAAASCGSSTTAASSTVSTGGARHPHPTFGATITQATPPPPVSGGTLLVTHDGHTAVASDPDRDAVYVVDLVSTDVATIALQAGDEPGRLAEDAAGHVHIALRAGGALVTLDPSAKTILARRDVCVAPRGVAYDADGDSVYVACMSGELVVLPAAGGPPTRTVAIARDLRDIVVQKDHLLVSRFRAADVLHISKSTWAVDAAPDVPQTSDDGATPSVA